MTNKNHISFVGSFENSSPLREAISEAYRVDETLQVETLLEAAQLNDAALQRIEIFATQLVMDVRKKRKESSAIDRFMTQYDLSSAEGIALMCVAEAMLRIPDSATIDKLLSDKLGEADWQAHLGASDSLFVNAATWSLMLTGKLVSRDEEKKGLSNALRKLAVRSGGGVIRAGVKQAMKILGKQFVMGRTIEEAVKRARKYEKEGFSYSYDMLGEAAHTAKDADRYFTAYSEAIKKIGKAAKGKGPLNGPGISVKLSALHPRYEIAKRERVLKELVPILLALAQLAKKLDIGLTVDAEESTRLELSFDIIEAVFLDPSLDGWEGLGLALQAYQKRAFYAIDYLAELAKRGKRRLMLRLVKGAYWDTEIKLAQLEGLPSYPVFTRKVLTDVSYIACAKKIVEFGADIFYPQFATHNASTLAFVYELAEDKIPYEFQCLHGMGESLYGDLIREKKVKQGCRIYAPVGSHEDLLPYLVRRLLENGANSSFVNRIVDENEPVSNLVKSPLSEAKKLSAYPHPNIPLPENLFVPERKNSEGVDLSDVRVLRSLAHEMTKSAGVIDQGVPLTPGIKIDTSSSIKVVSPSDLTFVGEVVYATEKHVDHALAVSVEAFIVWRQTSIQSRALLLDKMALSLEKNRISLMVLLSREAGKTLADAVSEVREAVDFCRYYAVCARENLVPQVLRGPTGEFNQLSYEGRGPIVCISPWNFPLAIFLGQIAAALVSGNTVIAKPAEQTSLIAQKVVHLFHEVGMPEEVLQLLPGTGEEVGARLVADVRVAGVIFTGSTEVARLINQVLANRKGPIVPLIAETGGLNAMIVDSSSLAEQVVSDAVYSAFGSCGQRCSALRIIYLQEDIADKFIEMLAGAMAEITVGDPRWLVTDVGPVIDREALAMLHSHKERMSVDATLLAEVSFSRELTGHYFAPCAYELVSIKQLPREVFGPILHVIRYQADKLNEVVDEINATGYGLTFGVHSRVNHRVESLCQAVHAGNCYVNRNIIGAVVGVQPFGGQGLSGTGPKAGGPNYLYRLSHEKSVSINTTAAGGNASLLSLEGD